MAFPSSFPADAGSKEGLEVWRIENLEAVKFDFSGELLSGDCFIFLHTYDKKGSRYWDLFFWLGGDCTADKRGSAAYQTVVLDDQLGGAPVQHREVQGHESDKFLALFPNGIRYVDGGFDSGWNYVDPDAYEPRLFHITGKRNARAQQVELRASSLNHGGVFLLDCGLKLFLWNGAEAHKIEKHKGLDVLTQMNIEEHGAKATVIVLEDGKEDEEEESKLFWATLSGSAKDVLPAEGGSNDDDVEAPQNKLLKVSTGGPVEFVLVGEGKLERDMLDSDDVFLVDDGTQVFVWVGKGSDKDEQRLAMKYATDYLEREGKPDWMPITRVIESGETPAFKAHFAVWDPRTVQPGRGYDQGSLGADEITQRLKELEMKINEAHSSSSATLSTQVKVLEAEMAAAKHPPVSKAQGTAIAEPSIAAERHLDYDQGSLGADEITQRLKELEMKINEAHNASSTTLSTQVKDLEAEIAVEKRRRQQQQQQQEEEPVAHQTTKKKELEKQEAEIEARVRSRIEQEFRAKTEAALAELEATKAKRAELEEKTKQRQRAYRQAETCPELPPDAIVILKNKRGRDSILGAGAGGTIFHATVTVGDEKMEVAVKIPMDKVPAAVARSEANIMHKATHGCEFVVGVIGMCLTDEEPMLVLKYCNSGSLLFDKVEKPALPELIRLLEQALAGIAHLHARGIHHRDIKPANLLLHRYADTGELVVKVTDFGSAEKDKASPSPTEAFFTMVSTSIAPGAAAGTGGTRVYMPSCAVRGDNIDAKAADVYSFVVTALHVLLGRPPYHWVLAAAKSKSQAEIQAIRAAEKEAVFPFRAADLAEVRERVSPALAELAEAVFAEEQKAPAASRLLSAFWPLVRREMDARASAPDQPGRDTDKASAERAELQESMDEMRALLRRIMHNDADL